MRGLTLIVLLLLALPTHAEMPAAAPPATALETLLLPLTEQLEVLDQPHDYLSQKFVGLVNEIDRFFGDERHYQEANHSVFQLDLHQTSGYAGEQKMVLAGRANVSLPNTEKRLHLLIESNPDKNTSGETPINQTTPIKDVSAPSSYAAAMRYEQATQAALHLSTDAGIKFQGLSSTPFTRARASYATPLDNWRMKITETAFWFNSTGIGASSQLDFERSLGAPTMLRASSNATWLHDKQNFDLRQDVSVFHTLNQRAALLYQASAMGVSQPQPHATDYVLTMLYRYRLHQKWMFFEISPQLHFPQIKNYQASPALLLRLEMLFDTER